MNILNQISAAGHWVLGIVVLIWLVLKAIDIVRGARA
jgi:hypothetical protein